MPDTQATPNELLIQSSVTDELQQMMKQLTPQQTQVLSLRFGLADGREMTFSEIGKKFNVSKQWAHQVAVKANARMKTSNTPIPELTAPETETAVSADTMPAEEVAVSAYSTPNLEDIWSAIVSDERISDTNANELLLLLSEQSSSVEQ